MKDSKNLVIGLLCAVVCIMAVAYAAFATTLNINGTAQVTSTWNVAITAIECSQTAVTGGEALEETVVKSFTGTTASFSFKFKQPGDTGTCTVTITNSGTLDAKVSKITVTDDSTAGTGVIQYTMSGINDGTLLNKSGGSSNTNTYTINAKFDDSQSYSNLTEEQKTKDLTVAITYVQNLTA